MKPYLLPFFLYVMGPQQVILLPVGVSFWRPEVLGFSQVMLKGSIAAPHVNLARLLVFWS